MEIKINDYYEPDHFRAICEDNYNISRTCEYEKNEMHHIHNTSEILLVEDGAADYYISGRKYHVEPYDILVIGAMEHHLRRIDRLPFSRYGFTVKPTYYRSTVLDSDLQKVFNTPTPEEFVQNYKNVDRAVFGQLIDMLCCLKAANEEEKATILMVTHDGYTASYARQVYFLKDGKIHSRLNHGESRKAFYEEIMSMLAAMGGEQE